MKNKPRLAKLTLHKQTLRILTSDEARRAAGGLRASVYSQGSTTIPGGTCVAEAACAR